MRVLVVTKIFPNAREPLSSPFNRQQLAALARGGGTSCDVEVLATIPWFPGASLFASRSRAGALVDVPRRDTIDGLPVTHPRFLYVPKIGDGVAVALYAASLLAPVARRRGRFDVLLAAWAFPDGAAAILLGELLRIPVVVKVHGSDLDVLGERAIVRAQLRATLPRTRALVAVSEPLARRAIELGAPPERTVVVRNGIDRERFAPRDRARARRTLGLPIDGRLIVFVGRVTEEKGVLDLIEAFALLDRPDVTLAIVGDGPAAGLVAARTAGARVILAGARSHDEIPLWLAAADLVTLPSYHEGTPNAILEAIVSGRRVVATNVGGVPDVVRDVRQGVLVPPRSPALLAAALAAEVDAPYDPEAVSASAGVPSWAESASALKAVLERACER